MSLFLLCKLGTSDSVWSPRYDSVDGTGDLGWGGRWQWAGPPHSGFWGVACPPWAFGPGCSEECKCEQQNTRACDKRDGSCACKAGFGGERCQDGEYRAGGRRRAPGEGDRPQGRGQTSGDEDRSQGRGQTPGEEGTDPRGGGTDLSGERTGPRGGGTDLRGGGTDPRGGTQAPGEGWQVLGEGGQVLGERERPKRRADGPRSEG